MLAIDSSPASPWPAYALITLPSCFHVLTMCLCAETTLCFLRACSVQFWVTSTQSSYQNTKGAEEVQSLEQISG